MDVKTNLEFFSVKNERDIKWKSRVYEFYYSLSLICLPDIRGHEAPRHHCMNSVMPASDISWFCSSYSHTVGNTVLRLLGSCPPCLMVLEIHAFPLSVCLFGASFNVFGLGTVPHVFLVEICETVFVYIHVFC